ncbi:flagellar hook-basal body complex protein FliE [Blastomonas natatoria]|uniref:Flagellar hook-basal body complex protein FliE n=1 Tax=Blastomonas natatoria TaxID=34015 RepID=A0A2V3V951_9SPHN|nr:flagellar hook-basal body complex protein FliE [Blastomonas natatoria]PXW78080.1 flagellar hook-basal body complex protein FliE [Blastomonas natatoria]
MSTNISSSIMAARNAILQQNSALQQISKKSPMLGTEPTETNSDGFSGTLKTALDQVNQVQHVSSQAATAYEMGQTTDIAAVMMAKQKASIGFEATLQVRNKLLSAYQDIMNMPV